MKAGTLSIGVGLVLSMLGAVCLGQVEVPLPEGVKAVWTVDRAWREKTPTRERVCLNGLWRWQPSGDDANRAPVGGWGYFKVPGCWPGITDYMQKDCQRVFAHPTWTNTKLSTVAAAWYQREMTIPGTWSGRRIALNVEYLNSYATIYVDSKPAGELRFPGGEVDLTSVCRPGGKHVLSLLVVAMPLKGVMLSYSDTASAKEVKGAVARRGLCGDVYLVAAPPGARISEVRTRTSVRRWEITFEAALQDLAANTTYALRAQVRDGGGEVARFTSRPFTSSELREGRLAFTETWRPEKLWDLHTPQNTYSASLSLLEAQGQVLDTAWPERFGFRELWIDGRDFILNGTRIFLSSVPLDNAQVSAALAGYDGARESLERLKSFGINMVYTHNYGCEPGSHLGFEEILRAADDAGMLICLSQPHFSHYDWKASDADQGNGYAGHAAFYVRVAGNHPSVVFYSMSHNAAGYSEDMNLDLLDRPNDPRDSWSLNNSRLALRAEAMVRRLDPSRIVYHHAGGNLGAMHATNFYPNFVPVQELSDWFEHWASQGVKPVFLCEYGAPFTWDWAMYRGWYKGQRAFGSAAVPWEFCFAEWNAQFLGDRAFQIGEPEKANLRWEARQFRAGTLWHRWDYPYEIGSRLFDDRHTVLAMYLSDNWRAFRTWGVSATSPWEFGHFWKPRDGVDRSRKDLKVDWENLQRPGFSADYIDQRYERMDLAFERSDWVPTADGQALIGNNRPLLAWIAGKPDRFSSKDHVFLPGETVEKQLVVINNSRQTASCECQWSLDLPQKVSGSKKITVKTGEQDRTALRFDLPASLAPGQYELRATVTFAGGEIQQDSFAIHVLPPSPSMKPAARIALFDPKGETAAWLSGRQVPYRAVEAGADLSTYEVLIIGKAALTVDGPGPDLGRVRDGLKVIVFEQTTEVLEKRLGFRTTEYGLRRVFKRLSDPPILAGLGAETLCDWRGEATILPARLKYEMRPQYGPTVKWCGIDVTRAWRCGCRGNVASVLIEKPACGDFLPILDGGYSLQYSPLLEYREGRGMILFCQMDVTGRTESDPAAERLARNIMDYVSAWQPVTGRTALYVGDAAGKSHLEKAGLSVGSYDGGKLSADQVLVVGPGGGRKLAPNAAAVADWLAAGGRLLTIALDQAEINAFLPFQVATRKAEHISAWFEPFGQDSPLAGVGPADVHNRDPREMPLVSAGAAVIGDGVLAKGDQAKVVFCQMAPWEFDHQGQSNLKRTFRRASFTVTRLLANMGVPLSTPILDRFHRPLEPGTPERRWLDGLYLDQPEEWDDPYRFFRW